MHEATAILRFQPVCAAMLREGMTIRFQAPGTSMLPTIHDGDTLVVEPVNATSVRRGDVVVVAGASCVHAHRVVRLPEHDGGFFVLRGDSLAACDAPVPFEGILGRVVLAERGGRCYRADGLSVSLQVGLFRLGMSCRRVLGRTIRAAARLAPAQLRSAFTERFKDGPHDGSAHPAPEGLERSLEVQI